MDLTHHEHGGVLIAKPADPRVDARHATALKHQLLALIEAGHPRIALDLSEVDFIDSSGLGAIIGALKQLGDRGHLVVVGARPAVVSLFRLTRMDKIVRMFRGEAEAVAALSS